MRIRLLVSIASLSQSYGKGSIIEVSEDEAKRFVADGLGVLEEETPVETAVSKAPKEKAIKKNVV